MIDWQGKRVLVTGGAGFIGSHLVDRLVELGAVVVVLDDFSTGRVENMDRAPAQLITADVCSIAACREACAGVDTVFHQAALANVPRSLERPAECIDVNVRGTATLFEAARDAKVRRIVFASSSSVYGDRTYLTGGDAPPSSPYALSKMMTEALAETFAASYGMELIGLRYFNVYGLRQTLESDAVVPRFLYAVTGGAQVVINGDGEQIRDFVHVSDVVEANLLAASCVDTNDAVIVRRRIAYSVLDVGTGRGVCLNHLAKLISPRPPLRRPARDGDVRHSVAHTSFAGSSLGFHAKVTLEEGLALTKATL